MTVVRRIASPVVRPLVRAINAAYGISAFTPARLFTTGVNGAWYDPSDYSTLYQNAAGTLPVTAVEQPVGLMLDKSKGLVLGPELVTNGDFSNGTNGWTLPINATVITESSFSGRLSVLKSVNNSTLGVTTTQSFSVVSGRAYEVSCYAYAPSSNSGVNAARLVVTSGISPAQNTSDGYVTTEDSWQFIKFVVFASAATITVGVNSSKSGAVITSGDIAYFDNISVRELPGNHAFNSSGNSANFPVLSARVNLLTKSEQFDDTAWNKVAFNYSANTPDTLDPIGGNTADFVYPTTANAPHAVIQTVTGTATSYVATIAAKTKPGSAYNWLRFGLYNGSSYTALAWFNVSTGQVGTVTSGTTITPTNLGNGWWRFGVSGALAASASCEFNLSVMGADGGSSSYAGDGTSGIYIWGADLRVANDALNQPAYQRVNTSTDYDPVGFKPYMRFNGTNQWLQTNSIDFTYGDKMFVCAGVRKLSDGSTYIVAELSQQFNINPGAFAIAYPVGSSLPQPSFGSNGTTSQLVYPASGYAAPITNVVSGIGNISGDQAILRINGTQAAISTADQGTGNYGNYPLYIGARAGSSLRFNGRLYQMVVAGKQATAAEITSTETYLNQKTGAF